MERLAHRVRALGLALSWLACLAGCATRLAAGGDVNSVRSDPVVGVLQRLAARAGAKDLPGVYRLLTPACRAGCRGISVVVISQSGGYQVARWLPRLDGARRLMDDLLPLLMSYRQITSFDLHPYQMRRYPGGATVRVRLKAAGVDMAGWRRVDSGLLDLVMLKRPVGWQVDAITPARIYTVRRADLGYRTVHRGMAVPDGARADADVDATIPGRWAKRVGLLVGQPGRWRWLETRGGRKVFARAAFDLGEHRESRTDADGRLAAEQVVLEIPRGPITVVLPRDFNGDGRTDLFVGSLGGDSGLWLQGRGGAFNREGRFGAPGAVTDAVSADFDGNGSLDLYIVRHGEAAAPPIVAGLPNLMFWGGVGGLKAAPGVAADRGWGLAACAGDLDDDGRIDLVVANEFGVSRLWRNLGRGRFVDTSRGVGFDVRGLATSCAIGDLDGDGRLDIYVGGRGAGHGYVFGRLARPPAPGIGLIRSRSRSATLQRLRAGGSVWFCRPLVGKPGCRYRRTALADPGWAVWSTMIDHDNDGDLDLWVGYRGLDSIAEDRWWWGVIGPVLRGQRPVPLFARLGRQTDRMWLNAQRGQLVPISWAAGLGGIRFVGAPVAFDSDGDGALDLMSAAGVLRWRGGEGDLGDLGATHGLIVRLIGEARGNRDAIGARVTLISEGRRQLREVGLGPGLVGTPPSYLHFGVGAHLRADQLIVRWPDGRVERHVDLPVDRLIVLQQGAPARWQDLGALFRRVDAVEGGL